MPTILSIICYDQLQLSQEIGTQWKEVSVWKIKQKIQYAKSGQFLKFFLSGLEFILSFFLFLFQFSLKINFCWFILCFISEDKKKKWQIKKKFYYNDNDCFVEIMEKKGKKFFIEVLWIQRHQVFWLRHWVHL